VSKLFKMPRRKGRERIEYAPHSSKRRPLAEEPEVTPEKVVAQWLKLADTALVNQATQKKRSA
jgi:hypothetical protein